LGPAYRRSHLSSEPAPRLARSGASSNGRESSGRILSSSSSRLLGAHATVRPAVAGRTVHDRAGIRHRSHTCLVRNFECPCFVPALCKKSPLPANDADTSYVPFGCGVIWVRGGTSNQPATSEHVAVPTFPVTAMGCRSPPVHFSLPLFEGPGAEARRTGCHRSGANQPSRT